MSEEDETNNHEYTKEQFALFKTLLSDKKLKEAKPN
jgi:hypothetical protein